MAKTKRKPDPWQARFGVAPSVQAVTSVCFIGKLGKKTAMKIARSLSKRTGKKWKVTPSVMHCNGWVIR